MFAFLFGLFQHEFVEALQSHIIPIEVEGLKVNKKVILGLNTSKLFGLKYVALICSYHRHVRVAGMQLQVDLLVNSSFAVFVIVLTSEGRHFNQ